MCRRAARAVVGVGMTNPGGSDPDERVVRRKLGDRHRRHLERVARANQLEGFHWGLLGAAPGWSIDVLLGPEAVAPLLKVPYRGRTFLERFHCYLILGVLPFKRCDIRCQQK